MESIRKLQVFTCFQVILFSYNRDRPTKLAVFHRPLLTPSPSFYFRNKDLKKDNFPAAKSYKTENVWPQGETKRPSYSMSSRTRYTQKENVPAPNRYSLPVLIGPKINISNKR